MINMQEKEPFIQERQGKLGKLVAALKHVTQGSISLTNIKDSYTLAYIIAHLTRNIRNYNLQILSYETNLLYL